jgi:hypothetical protein
VKRREFQQFVDELPMYRQRMGKRQPAGNEEVLQQIRQMIPLTPACSTIPVSTDLVAVGADL